MDLQLKDKVAVVLAGSRGLGAATARALAREGARLVLTARTTAALEATAADLGATTGAQVIAQPGDATRIDDLRAVFQRAVADFGRVDAVIINAGGPPQGAFMSLDDATWEAAVQGTLMNAVRATRLAIETMTPTGGGSITLIESASIRTPLDNMVLSNALRLGVAGMVKTLSREVARQGIRINLICPGAFLTERWRSLTAAGAANRGSTYEAEVAAREAGIPQGRIGDPEEFGRVCAFLASPAASYVTGAAWVVDGGASRAF
ncbi:MAG: SDR family oxidoreductase [Thermoflexales bacterium]|nr:SDR family oxidoreductase [Thermoflexales bacterium]